MNHLKILMMKLNWVILVFLLLSCCNNEKTIDPDDNIIDRFDTKEKKVVSWDTVQTKTVVVDIDDSVGEKVNIRMH